MLRTPTLHSSPHLSTIPFADLPVPRVIITPCTPLPPVPTPSSGRHARNRSSSSRRSSLSDYHASTSSSSGSRADSVRSRNLMEAMSMEPDTQLLSPTSRHRPAPRPKRSKSPVVACIFLAMLLVLIMSSILGIGDIKTFSLGYSDTPDSTHWSGERIAHGRGEGWRDRSQSITFKHNRDMFRRRDVKERERHSRLSRAMSYEWLGDNAEGEGEYQAGPTGLLDAWDFH